MTKFLGGVGHGPRNNGFNFGDVPDHRPDPGVRSPKSALTGLSKKLPTDIDEILWRVGVWPRDQLITFSCHRPVTIRITIRIRESVPDHDPDQRPDPGVRNPKSGFTGFWRSAEVCALGALLVSYHISSFYLIMVRS